MQQLLFTSFPKMTPKLEQPFSISSPSSIIFEVFFRFFRLHNYFTGYLNNLAFFTFRAKNYKQRNSSPSTLRAPVKRFSAVTVVHLSSISWSCVSLQYKKGTSVNTNTILPTRGNFRKNSNQVFTWILDDVSNFNLSSQGPNTENWNIPLFNKYECLILPYIFSVPLVELLELHRWKWNSNILIRVSGACGGSAGGVGRHQWCKRFLSALL